MMRWNRRAALFVGLPAVGALCAGCQTADEEPLAASAGMAVTVIKAEGMH